VECPNCRKKFEHRAGLLFCEVCGWHDLNPQGEIVPAAEPEQTADLPPDLMGNAEPEPHRNAVYDLLSVIVVCGAVAVVGYVMRKQGQNAIEQNDGSRYTPDETQGASRSLWF